MKSREIARRYATALYSVAVDDGTVTETQEELAAIARAATGDPTAQRFLSHPRVPKQAKAQFLEKAFPAISERMRNFLGLMIRNRRETYLDLVRDEYVAIRAADEGRLRVTVTTARPLAQEDRSRLLARLEQAMKRPIELKEQTEERLLGGIRIETAGRVLDGTLRAKLNKLRAQLEA